MKNKLVIGLIATATIGGAVITPVISNDSTQSKVVNSTLLVGPSQQSTNSKVSKNSVNNENLATNEAVVIDGNSNIVLFPSSNGESLGASLSVGQMLTVLGQPQNGYCRVKVQETGNVGYINTANMQNILNGTNDILTTLSKSGQVINVSSNVRLRSNPDISASIIGHLSNGTSLKVIGKQGQWYKVTINGQIGFVYGEYIGGGATNSTLSSKVNSTSGTTSNSHVKNIIVRTKNSQVSNTGENSQSSNSQSGITTRSKSSSTSNTISNSGTTSSNNIANKNQIYPNDNTLVSKYFGTWTVGKQIGRTIGRNGTFKSYEGQKIIMTSSLYSFNGTSIKNPNYYIVTISLGDLFGNSQYNNIPNIQTNNGEVELIVAVPSSEKITSGNFFDKIELSALNNEIIINGNSLITHGGGAADGSINQCARGDAAITGTTSQNSNSGTSSNNTTGGSQGSLQSSITSRTKSSGVSQINNNSGTIKNTTGNSSKIVVQNVEQAMTLVKNKIGTTGKDGKIVWTYMSNTDNPSGALFTGNNGVKFYLIRGDYQSFINHRNAVHGCGTYDGLDYYVLQNGTIISSTSAQGQSMFI